MTAHPEDVMSLQSLSTLAEAQLAGRVRLLPCVQFVATMSEAVYRHICAGAYISSMFFFSQMNFISLEIVD